jgi:hypothetical protein
VAEVMESWKSGQLSPLLVEATTCFLCGEKATGSCVFGGHMVCEFHQFKKEMEGKIQSPLLCCGKYRPIWPNPFRAFYVEPDGYLLDHGQSKDEFHFQDHILVWKRPQKLHIRTWRFQADMFPCDMELDTAQVSINLPVWRVLVRKIGIFDSKEKKSLSRCLDYWQTRHPLQILRDIQHPRWKHFRVWSHPDQLFMYVLRSGQAICFCCRQETALNLFAESPCCLFSLAELEKCIELKS